MPIPELIKFREKYPQYNDLDDVTIARKLGEKYPDAYGNLLAKAIEVKSGLKGISKRPDLIDTMAGISPEELAETGQWVLSGIQQTGKDILTIPAHFFNQMLLNYPRSITRTTGMQYPEIAQSPIAQGLAQVAGITGGITSPALNWLATLGRGAQIAQAPLRLKALAGGLTGLAYAPTENIADIKQRVSSGLISAAVPIAGAGISKMISKIPNRSELAGRIVNSLIKPLKKDFAYGKNPGLAVAQEKIVANDLDDLAIKISQRREEIGKQIGGVLRKAKGMVDMRGVLRPIDASLARARQAPITNASLITRLEGLREDLRGIIGGKDLEMATPQLAFKMKQKIGDLTKWTGNISDDQLVNKSLKMVYGRLKERIERIVPAIKSLNEKYGNLTSAEVATKYRNQILQRQNLIGLTSTTAGLGSALLTAIMTGGKTIPTVIAGLGMTELIQLTKSPKVITRLASWLAKSTPEARQTLFQKLPQLKELIIKGEIALPSRLIDKLRSE